MRGVRDCLLTALEPPLVQGPLHGRVGICGRWGDGLLAVASLHSQRSAARRQIRGRWPIMSAACALLCCVSRVGLRFRLSFLLICSPVFASLVIALCVPGLNANHATHTPTRGSLTRSRPHLRGHTTPCGGTRGARSAGAIPARPSQPPRGSLARPYTHTKRVRFKRLT